MESSMKNIAIVHGSVRKVGDWFATEPGAYVVAYKGAKLRASRWSYVLALRDATVVADAEAMITAEAGAHVVAEAGSSVLAREGAIIFGRPGCSVTLCAGAILYMDGQPKQLFNRGGTVIPVDKNGKLLKRAPT